MPQVSGRRFPGLGSMLKVPVVSRPSRTGLGSWRKLAQLVWGSTLLSACVGAAPLGEERPADASQPASEGPVAATRSDYARGLGLAEVAIYQSVKVSLMRRMVEPEQRNAPVVAGREATLRVFVHPDESWQPREVTVRLSLAGVPGGAKVLERTQRVELASSEADLGSSINFRLRSDQVTEAAAVRVELLETAAVVRADGAVGQDAVDERADSQGAGAKSATGQVGQVRWPREGHASLAAERLGPLRVRLVPIRYAADGSNRLPELPAAQLEAFRERLLELYPVSSVELSVREPVASDVVVRREGQGWAELLQRLVELRQADAAPADMYYYGLANPAVSNDVFCKGSCVGGLAPEAGPADSQLRVGVGLGYDELSTVNTLVHELAHAHGRKHAPCGDTHDVDPDFPYARAALGSWGFSAIEQRVLGPEAHSDFLSYCSPSWVSDYTYGALAERIRRVASSAQSAPADEDASTAAEPRQWRTLVVEQDGSMRWGEQPIQWRGPAGARPATMLHVRDASGRPLTIMAYRYPLSDSGAVMWMVPRD